ncbi:MAG: GNAT family N-acetyltransferase [Ruminococcus sp.]|nr:GNAT family N-acetyltransferase [Ruminococcus sp.]MBQ5311278.1 GNAT family N-acetyltransferase [Oscillospiraceae bacterium]
MMVRRITPADSRMEISRIYEQSWKYAYKGLIPQSYLDSIPEGRWASHCDKAGMYTLVYDDGALVGTSSFCRSRWKDHPDDGEIVSIYFLPGYIGKGCGHELFCAAERELHDMGFEHILLWVLEGNTRARKFYEKHGYTLTGEVLDDNIGGRDIREVMYRK